MTDRQGQEAEGGQRDGSDRRQGWDCLQVMKMFTTSVWCPASNRVKPRSCTAREDEFTVCVTASQHGYLLKLSPVRREGN